MADNLVELDDLLRRLHAKESAAAKTATSPSAPKVEETTRPFQTLCNEAIRAYGDANVENGETTLDALREEVASAGVSADKPPVLPLSNAYAANRNERLRLVGGMYDSCLRAVSAAKQGVRSARSRAKALLKARTATADAKKKAWEKKAGAVSKQQYANVSDQLRRVETDWASLVEGNGRLEALQGGGVDDPVMRLETAKALGTEASASTFARAEDYGRAKQRHANVEWRLSETVRHVTDEYLARTHANVEKSLRATTQATIDGARAAVRKAIADYNVEDAALRHEGSRLEQQSDAGHRVDQKALAVAQHIENDFRVRLKKVLRA